MPPIFSKSLPSTNKRVLDILSLHEPWENKILDLGAGEGYFSSILCDTFMQAGDGLLAEHIYACDLFPSEYKFDKIRCNYCDFNSSFPYEDNTFQAVCSIEVLEHLENPSHFMREIFRILKPGGVAIITTPNILNLNSRLKAFVTGFPLLFDPLHLASHNPRDLGGHINPISFYYLAYIMERAGFKNIKLHTDRLKVSAKTLMYLLYIPIKLGEKIVFRKMKKDDRSLFEENYKYISQINSKILLLGRTVILEAVK